MRKTAMAASAVLALALAPASALAQEDMSDEMSGDDMMTGTMVPHPSHIHAGDCSMPDDVVAGLSRRRPTRSGRVRKLATTLCQSQYIERAKSGASPQGF